MPVSKHADEETTIPPVFINRLVCPIYYACLFNSLRSLEGLKAIHTSNLVSLKEAGDHPDEALLRHDLGMLTKVNCDLESTVDAAARLGHANVLRLLFTLKNTRDLGVNIHYQSLGAGDWSLTIAIKSRCLETFNLLLNHEGCDFSVVTEPDDCIIHCIASHGTAEMMEAFLKKVKEVNKNFDINMDADGDALSEGSKESTTALHAAAKAGNVETARTLLAHGAGVDFLDYDGLTVLDSVNVYIERTQDEKLKQRYREMQVLIKAQQFITPQALLVLQQVKEPEAPPQPPQPPQPLQDLMEISDEEALSSEESEDGNPQPLKRRR